MSEFNYLVEKRRMLDSLGRTNGCCCGVSCITCPLREINGGTACFEHEIDHPEKATEIVRKWAEEHPRITNGEKLNQIVRDVFGGVSIRDSACVAHDIGIIKPCDGDCNKCRDWMNAEYKQPEKEREAE